MRIGFFTDGLPYKDPISRKPSNAYIGGGIGEVSFNLAINMAELGHEIFIFTKSCDRKDSIKKYKNITIIRYKSRFKVGMAQISPDIIFKPVFSTIKLDIVHAHMGLIFGPIGGLLFSRIKGIPLIITYHGDIYRKYGSFFYLLALYISDLVFFYLLKKSDKIIALSKENISSSKYLKLFNNKITIIPNAVNIEDYKINQRKEDIQKQLNLPAGNIILLFVGTLSQHKGVFTLIDAMKIIIKEYQNVHLIFVGDGSARDNLIHISNENKLSAFITFTGTISEEKLKILYYQASDIFILPSFTEAFPITLLEASSAELPLVVSDIESLKAIVIDGLNGLITVAGSENDLAEKVLILLKNGELRRKMGRQSHQKISHLSWKSVALKTEGVYRDILNNGKK